MELMKINIKTKMAVCLTAFLSIAISCTDNFEEINTSPTLITEEMVRVDGLLTRVQKLATFAIPGFNRIAEFAGNTSLQDSGYPFQIQDYGGYYNGFYTSYLVNMNELIRLTAEDPKLSNKNAIAKIYTVWLWQNLTDRFGDVPFSEMSKSQDDIILQPKYDTQESIYRQLFTTLKEATAQLSNDAAQESFGDADLIFKGSVDSWIRFANSLRLRMALRVRYADQALAQENIDDVIGQPLITENSQNASLLSEPSTSAIEDNRSPIYNYILDNYSNALVPGFPYMELLYTKNDPRLTIYFNESASGIYRGRPVNLESPQEKERFNQDDVSYLGDYFRGSTFTFNIITAAEVNFLRAEAALFGLSGENEQSLFQDGIQDAMLMYAVSQNDIDTFLASEGTLTGTDEEKLKQIIDQKYIALFYQSDEAWSEYRRTGYPLIWIGSGLTSTGGIMPRRLTYPNEEYVKNATKVTEAAGRLQGGDVLVSRVWWDAKPGLPFDHPLQGSFPPDPW